MVFLVLLLGAAGVVIYTAVTNQTVDLTEDIRTVGLELENPVVVDGLTINIAEDPGGSTPVVFLHDVDVTGGLILADLSESLAEEFHGVRIDLPGFGYSDRMPFRSTRHTASGMAETISAVLDDRFDEPVKIVGVGFGGNVAAEVALTRPELVSGVVMVDTDLWSRPRSFQLTLERLPWVGKAATYTWETGGRYALSEWAPYCEQGGWCPTLEQQGLRAFIITIEDTTESLQHFLDTNEAALAPSNLSDISAPMVYVWSTSGSVDQDIIDRLGREIPGIQVFESASFQAHLEDFTTVNEALASITS